MIQTLPTEEATRAIEAAYVRRPAVMSAPTAADWQRLHSKFKRAFPWSPGEPLREVAVAAFEARHGVRLPPEFRCLVRLIGDEAPRSLCEWHPWDDALTLPWHQAGPSGPHGPFWHGPVRGGALGLTWPNHWGVFVLAVSGPEPGTVWLSMTLREHMRPTGLGFFAWYERYLDERLVSVEAEDEVPRLEQQISGGPEDGPMLLCLTRAATMRGDAELAARSLARARALGHELDPDAMRELIVAATTRDNDLAIATRITILLTAGFPLPPLSAPALTLRLGQRLTSLERHAEAVAVLEPLLQAAAPAIHDTRQLRWTLAVSLTRLGRSEQALALIGPQQGRRWFLRWLSVRCLVALGRLREARRLVDRIPGGWDEIPGYLEFKLGALPRAEERLLKALAGRRYPGVDDLYALALVQARRGALAAAEQSLLRALEAKLPIATVIADVDAEPLRATEVFRRWSAPDPPASW